MIVTIRQKQSHSRTVFSWLRNTAFLKVPLKEFCCIVISSASKEKNFCRQLENFHAAEFRTVLPPAHQRGDGRTSKAPSHGSHLGGEELSANSWIGRQPTPALPLSQRRSTPFPQDLERLNVSASSGSVPCTSGGAHL